jgi:hypothetical protein
MSNETPSPSKEAQAYIAGTLEVLGSQDPLEALQATVPALRRILASLSPGQIRQPEADRKWSIAQTIQHLADSELVFGYRVRMALAHDRPRLGAYDENLWAQRLHYAGANADEALQTLDVLRRSNLRLISAATDDDLARVGLHEERGVESVAQLIRLEAGHDLVHLRQVDRIRRAVAP